MHKSLRNFALLALLSLSAAPVMMAETTGCDPRPKKTGAAPTFVQTLQYTVLAYFGL